VRIDITLAAELEMKIERLEEKMMNDEIEPNTYKSGLVNTRAKGDF
jgi:hypothetical protein